MEQQPPAPLEWVCGTRRLSFAAGPVVMGILNVTPDSFSDGGRYCGGPGARRGARLRDGGGRRGDPGHRGRIIAPGRRIRSRRTKSCGVWCRWCGRWPARCRCCSRWTPPRRRWRRRPWRRARTSSTTSRGPATPAMVDVARRSGAGVVLMHMRGTPRTMQADPHYDDVVAEVARYLGERVARLRRRRGWRRESLVVDPGICFGKTVEHNRRCWPDWARWRPWAAGPGRRVAQELPGQTDRARRGGPAAAEPRGAGPGAARGRTMARVHDVKESCEVARLVAMLKAAPEAR
jgi:dihydropteroate synthase